MRRTVIESPFAGDEDKNRAYARQAMAHAIGKGEAPYASHLLYTQVLFDENPDERLMGMEAGFAWAAQAELCAVYVDRGLSEGMRAGIQLALKHKIPVEFRSLASRVGTVVAEYDGGRHEVALFTEWQPWLHNPAQIAMPFETPPEVVHEWAMGSLEAVCGIRAENGITGTMDRGGVTCPACKDKTA